MRFILANSNPFLKSDTKLIPGVLPASRVPNFLKPKISAPFLQPIINSS